jgi:hypothetical protein
MRDPQHLTILQTSTACYGEFLEREWELATASLVWWSDFLATDSEVPSSIPGAAHIFRVAVGLERGSLSLVRINEELL